MSAAPRPQPGPAPSVERTRAMRRFGSRAELRVQVGARHAGLAEQRLDRAAAVLAEFDRRLSRFDPDSELCRLNADHRDRVPASAMMQRFVEAVGWAGRRSGGLVDATVLPAVERTGYVESFDIDALDTSQLAGRSDGAPPMLASLGAALRVLAAEEAARDLDALGGWRAVRADGGAVVRPAGLRLDSGGIGKGLAADLAADVLRGAPSWVVDCGGDLRIGGSAGVPRPVDVTDPLDPRRIIHRLHIARGGVATSGVTRRSWDVDGERRHHLIDPRTGRPADTGVLQVTAITPTALEAEVLAKTALLAGAELAHTRLEHGGVVVGVSGTVTIVPPPQIDRCARRRRVHAQLHVPGRAPVLRVVEGRR